MANEGQEPGKLPKHTDFSPTLPDPGVRVKDAKLTKDGQGNCGRESVMSEGKSSLHNIEKGIYAGGILLAAVIIAVGVFQPWVSRGGGVGVESNLGLLILIASVSLAILAVRFLLGSGPGKDMCAIASVVSLAVVFVAVRLIWDVLDVGDAEAIGSGLYLLLIGGALSAMCSLSALIRAIAQQGDTQS